jgi:hypothetical protein
MKDKVSTGEFLRMKDRARIQEPVIITVELTLEGNQVAKNKSLEIEYHPGSEGHRAFN